MKKRIKIAWLSDIHLSELSTTDVKVQTLFQEVGQIANSECVDYIVLTGDIALSGKAEQYDAFKSLLDEMNPRRIPVISIPGNHDLDLESYQKWLTAQGSMTIDRLSSGDVLQKSIPDDVMRGFVNFQRSTNPDSIFCNDNAHGYYFDECNGILFLQLNSSWYSFADRIIYQALINDIEHSPGKNLKSKLESFGKKFKGDSLTQIAKQSYRLHKFIYWAKIDAIIKEHQPIVVTLAHHPPSWLRWGEANFEKEEKTELAKLYERSHLLLTGHLHSPYVQHSILEGECIHLANGCLLEHKLDLSLPAHTLFEGSLWCLLELSNESITATTIRAPKFDRDNVENKWSWVKEKGKGHSEIQFPKDKYPFVPKVKSLTIVETKISIDDFVGILSSQRGIHLTVVSKFEIGVTMPYFELVSDTNETYLVVINAFGEHRGPSDWSDLFYPTGQWSAWLDKAISLQKGETDVVIAFYDLVQRPSVFGKTAIEDYEGRFESYRREREIRFHAFKHAFFSESGHVETFMDTPVIHDCILFWTPRR